jgi:hypothetical protein
MLNTGEHRGRMMLNKLEITRNWLPVISMPLERFESIL